MTEPGVERRKFKRFDLTCPIIVSDSEGRELLRTRTVNISEGGALLSAPPENVIPLGESVQVFMKVPRTTPNTHMFEEFFAGASAVRHDGAGDDGEAGVALKFDKQVLLDLEA